MANPTDKAGETRIIIDEDWKSQVQAEKERAAQAEPAAEPAAEPGGADSIPPASFSVLLATIATQAVIALGAVTNPATQKAEPSLDEAKHLIDILGMLEEKTRNNLTPDEERYLKALLFDLRLQYVEAAKSPPGTPAP
jgi:hypothetical protein